MPSDLWGMKGQAVAICLVMACGVSTVMSSSAYTFSRSRPGHLLRRYRFADVFTPRRAPNDFGARIAVIPGVPGADAGRR